MLPSMEFELTPTHPKRSRQVLSVRVDARPAGHLRLGVADVDDSDDPTIRLDYVEVDHRFSGTGLSVELVRWVRVRWPLARVLGGPVSQDDDPGPRFRLRCWDEAEIEIHEPNCQSGPCMCRDLIVAETAKRYRKWFENGGLTSEQLSEKLAILQF